ncbi:MAG: glycosyltransferase family 9 protein, partial [Proteobacteria bacterium]|nr:glycosyltransferase family 9 protein [Pseudomonadota bacterium]
MFMQKANINNPSRIIISRTDNIGDVILTLPVVALLKEKFPQAKIIFLARNYVKDIVAAYPAVDQFIDSESLLKQSPEEQLKLFKALNADTIIHVFPNKAIAQLAKKANIQNRIGTCRRLYHITTCNYRVNFTRKGSSQHEAQLNLKLLAPFGIDSHYTVSDLTPYFQLTPTLKLSEPWSHVLDSNRFNIIVHPGSNGNTREWPAYCFQELIESLPKEQFNILITGSEKEAERFAPLLQATENQATNLMGKLKLSELLALIAACDGIVASSTGPLHIGAAMGVYALGLFPPVIGMDPSRWGPLGRNASYLVTPHACAGCAI